MPDRQSYQRENVPVGQASFWFIGRGDREGIPDDRSFSLVDEASKLNLNIATREMLEALPRMTPELAAAVLDWRDADNEVTAGGAEDETYGRRNPSYKCKNSRFESVDELRLVFGMDLEILYGEDANRNGILDPNENDGNASPPNDNRDGRLDPGIAEYATVYSRESNTRTNVNNQLQLASLLQQNFSTDRANQILLQISGGPGSGGTGIRSVLEFYVRSQMTAEEFAQIEGSISATNSAFVEGLINVNTASAAVLACVPGIGSEKAESLVAYRQSNPSQLTSVAWVVEALGEEGAVRAGPYLTSRSYQLRADIAAVGHHGRGYRRVSFVFDTSEGTPRIRYRQDLTPLGWALGKDVRQMLRLTMGAGSTSFGRIGGPG